MKELSRFQTTLINFELLVQTTVTCLNDVCDYLKSLERWPTLLFLVEPFHW